MDGTVVIFVNAHIDHVLVLRQGCAHTLYIYTADRPGFTVMPSGKYLTGGLQPGCTANSIGAQYTLANVFDCGIYYGVQPFFIGFWIEVSRGTAGSEKRQNIERMDGICQ